MLQAFLQCYKVSQCYMDFSVLQKVKANPFYDVRRIFTMLEGFLRC